MQPKDYTRAHKHIEDEYNNLAQGSIDADVNCKQAESIAYYLRQHKFSLMRCIKILRIALHIISEGKEINLDHVVSDESK